MKLDNYTKRHLARWFELGKAPCSYENNESCMHKMIEWLEKKDEDEALYFLANGGWIRVFDESEAFEQ